VGSGKAVLPFVTFTYNCVPTWQQGLVWASWTIGVEMVFYLLFLWVWRATRTVRAVVWLMVALVMATAFAAAMQAAPPSLDDRDVFVLLGLPTALPAFAIGTLTFRLAAYAWRPGLCALVGAVLWAGLLWAPQAAWWLRVLAQPGMWCLRTKARRPRHLNPSG
jgi:peptidoglycan/LPS O-acetylase OafA/YrhL